MSQVIHSRSYNIIVHEIECHEVGTMGQEGGGEGINPSVLKSKINFLHMKDSTLSAARKKAPKVRMTDTQTIIG